MSNSLLDYSTLCSSVLHCLLEFAKIHVHWVGDAANCLILLSPSPFAFHLSQHQGLFQWAGSSQQVAQYWSFSFNISNEYSGLISFRTDWFDLFAVQGPLKCLFQHRNLKASVLWCSTFFMAHHSHLYMTTGKTIAFTVQTFVSTCIISLFIQIFGGEGNYHPLLYMKKQAWEKFKKLS